MSRVMQRAHVELHESLEKERKEANSAKRYCTISLILILIILILIWFRKLSEIQTKCDLKLGVAVERAKVQFLFFKLAYMYV